MVSKSQHQRKRVLTLAIAISILLLGLFASPSSASTTPTEGVIVDEAVARGTLQVKGIVQPRPNFQKWQLDLLLHGSAERETFLALGQEPQIEMGVMAEIDTSRYPDGDHLLRLRIVDHRGNYSEHIAPVNFANAGSISVRRRIEVDLSDQMLTAWEDDLPVLQAQVSTGRATTPTVTGRFQVRAKLPLQHMTGVGYDLPDVPSVMYFFGGYAIHGAYWHNNFGQPMSHGCVNMRPDQAAALYQWAEQGTEVIVHD